MAPIEGGRYSLSKRGPVVYLIHYAKAIAHAQHYLGVTPRLAQRLRAHQNGNGASLTSAFSQHGIQGEIVRLWRTDTLKAAYLLEARLKHQKNNTKLCPKCNKGNKRGRSKA